MIAHETQQRVPVKFWRKLLRLRDRNLGWNVGRAGAYVGGPCRSDHGAAGEVAGHRQPSAAIAGRCHAAVAVRSCRDRREAHQVPARRLKRVLKPRHDGKSEESLQRLVPNIQLKESRDMGKLD